MTNAFTGEIRLFGNNFAPRDWATCDGQLLSIAQNSALFAIIGTYFGGDGRVTFALPNFQGATGIDQGTGSGLSTYVMGEQTGTPNVTLLQSEMPMHNHAVNTRTPGTGTQGSVTIYGAISASDSAQSVPGSYSGTVTMMLNF